LILLRQVGWLSAATVYGVTGVACAVACLGWWMLDRQPIRFSRSRCGEDWRRNWSFGKWAMTSQLIGLAFYVLPWLLASVRGEAETGRFAACSTLVGLSNLFVLGMNNLLMPKAAQAFAHRGSHGLFMVLRTAMAWSVVVLGGLCLAVLFAGNHLAEFVYGHSYAEMGPLIAMLALATFADAMGLMAGIGLWAMDRPSSSVCGDVVQLITTLGVAVWLVFSMGAMGVAIAMVVGRFAGAIVRWATLRLLVSATPCVSNLA
jgi:O-antigen/teichoic acid export membrane protein